MQGRLRREPLTVTIDSSCASCGRALTIELTDRLEWRVNQGPETILVFEPEVGWSTFQAETIVKDY